MRLIALSLLFFASSTLCLDRSYAREAGQERDQRIIVHGEAARPFPAVLNLDYPLARAEAWLRALKSAERHLPSAWQARMADTDLSGRLAAMAICALAFPIDVVTPEKRLSDTIRVFLRYPANLEEILNRITARPWLVAREMAVVWEMGQAVDRLRQVWPDSANGASSQLDLLETQRALLEELWQASRLLRQEMDEAPQSWRQAISARPQSIPGLLELAREDGNLESAEQSVTALMEAEAHATNGELRKLWNRLLIMALSQRAREHARLNQTALAETDLDAAIARLERAGIKDETARAIILARADLKKGKRDLEGMCPDYEKACALGDCTGLALVRQSGLCRGAQ